MRSESRFRRYVEIIMAMVALAGCDDAAAPEPPPSAPVTVTTLVPSHVELTEDLPGRVAAVRVAEIRPQVGGIVRRRLFVQGAEIQAGEPLFQIDPAPFKADAEMAAAALKRAESALARARAQTRRLEPLVATEAISRQAYDDAVAQRDQAAADVTQARAILARRHLDLKFATVDAPIFGRIDQALVTEGALVSPSDANPMARIQQVDQVYVDVRQPAASLAGLRQTLASPGAERRTAVAILRQDGTPYDVSGRILFSGIAVDAETGDVLLRVLVDNPQRDLLPGMFVRARVPRASYADALLVPQEAVARVGGMPQVWVVGSGDAVRAVPVELGELVERRYRIRSGLEAGERIVVEGQQRLRDGAVVAPREWRPLGLAAR